MISVIIPSRNEQYLGKTIENILANARGEIEVLAMLDGWVPDPQLVFDERVKFIHYPESIGQRQCVNKGVEMAKGEYIMKLDAHCAVDEGFDVKLAADCEKDWTVIPRMYNLDVNTWKPKLHKRTDYMYFSGPNEEKPFRAQYYTGKEFKDLHARPDLIDDTMCCMGPGWFMRKDRFLELGGMDEKHGSWGQMGIELACKAWLSGGRMVVNKKTWFAHWFRGGGGPGFPYKISGNEQERARKYSQDLWLNNKWPLAKRKLSWLIDKFNPPTWGEKMEAEIDTDIININRQIRKHFDAMIRNDYAPYACKRGDRITLLDMFAKIGYKKGIEIGTNRAAYSYEMLKRIPDLDLTVIDPWSEYQYSHRTEDGQNRDYGIAINKLKPWIDKGKCKVIRDYSFNVHNQFEDGSLDFIYIDGDHCFDGICLDLIYWCRKVRKHGIVAVHDYYKFRRSGVVEAVNGYTRCHMIKDWYTTKEVMPTAFWVVQ